MNIKCIYNNEKGEEKTIDFYDYFDHLKKHGFQ